MTSIVNKSVSPDYPKEKKLKTSSSNSETNGKTKQNKRRSNSVSLSHKSKSKSTKTRKRTSSLSSSKSPRAKRAENLNVLSVESDTENNKIISITSPTKSITSSSSSKRRKRKISTDKYETIELWSLIMTQLNRSDVNSIAMVSHKFNAMVHSPRRWYTLCQYEFELYSVAADTHPWQIVLDQLQHIHETWLTTSKSFAPATLLGAGDTLALSLLCIPHINWKIRVWKLNGRRFRGACRLRLNKQGSIARDIFFHFTWPVSFH